MTPPTSETACAWTLRQAWSRHREIALTLSDRCLVPTIVGHVGHVAVSGATATIDGWTIPLGEVTDIAPATNANRHEYAQLVRERRTSESVDLEGEAR